MHHGTAGHKARANLLPRKRHAAEVEREHAPAWESRLSRGAEQSASLEGRGVPKGLLHKKAVSFSLHSGCTRCASPVLVTFKDQFARLNKGWVSKLPPGADEELCTSSHSGTGTFLLFERTGQENILLF